MKECIKIVEKILLILLGCCLGGYLMAHKYCIKLKSVKTDINRWQVCVRLYDLWMITKQSGQSIEEYLSSKGICNIAIYGTGYLGIRLYYELKDSCINVKYVLDKNPNIRLVGVDMFDIDHCSYKMIDAVIVTELHTYDSVKTMLNSKGYKQIFAFDDIIYEMMTNAQKECLCDI